MQMSLILVLLLAALGATGGAVNPPAPPPAAPASEDAACRDRIEQVRAANRQPLLDRRTASPEEPLLIAAVDQRIGDCSVLVMRRDTSDLRPLPVPDNFTGLRPAR